MHSYRRLFMLRVSPYITFIAGTGTGTVRKQPDPGSRGRHSAEISLGVASTLNGIPRAQSFYFLHHLLFELPEIL